MTHGATGAVQLQKALMILQGSVMMCWPLWMLWTFVRLRFAVSLWAVIPPCGWGVMRLHVSRRLPCAIVPPRLAPQQPRSEERRVGKEGRARERAGQGT